MILKITDKGKPSIIAVSYAVFRTEEEMEDYCKACSGESEKIAKKYSISEDQIEEILLYKRRRTYQKAKALCERKGYGIGVREIDI